MRVVEASMKRPVTVVMITIAAVLFGLVALSRLSLNLLPDISYPTLTIRTEYADSAPAEVEKLITEPLEEAVSVVQGLRNLRSDSRAGVSEITLEFAWKLNMDYAALDVREKIDLVDLPEDADSPVLLRYDPALDPILRIGLYGDRDLVTLRYLSERVLKKDLEALEGVASVRVRSRRFHPRGGARGADPRRRQRGQAGGARRADLRRDALHRRAERQRGRRTPARSRGRVPRAHGQRVRHDGRHRPSHPL